MRQRGTFFLLLMKNALFALFLFSGLTASAATLRAGVATVDISPTEFPRIIAGRFLEGRGEKLAEVLNSAEPGSSLQGAALSSVLPHLEWVCARADAKSFAMLLRCALATKNEKAIAALVTRMDAQKGL